MLGRGRFIPGKAAASRRKSKDCPDDESRAEGVIHGTATLLSGLGGGLSLDGKSLDPTAPQTASRNPPEKTKNSANVVTTNKKQHSMLSPNAALLLCPAGLQADEIEVDGADDVSSMNDSIYFGGGASVTGGYARRRNPSRPSPPHVQSLKRSGDRVAPGASPEVPTNLLGVHDSDVHSVDSGNGNPPSPLADVEQAMGNVQPTTPRRNADFALVDIDYAMANKHENQRDGANAAISPTSAIISAASNDKSPNNKSSRCCCCCETPGWIQRAPYWLKAVLVGSIVLLLAAIALVAVGLLMAYDKGGNSSLSSSSSQAQGSATSVVTLAPTTSTSSKMTAPTVKQNSTAQTPPGPGKDDLTKLMVIYLTAGQYSDNLKQQAGTGLSTFPTREGTSFMVHMGDWNDPSMNCDGKSYQAESDLFHPSSIPVYFVMGANDSNGCSDPTAALALWKKYFLQYESKFWQPPPWKIVRQGDTSPEFKDFSENFLFAYGQAAFVSIDVVNGAVNNATNVQLRQQANTAWIKSAYELCSKTAVSTIFILANDGPPGVPSNSQFYMDLLAKIKTDYADKDFVLVYRGRTPSWGLVEQYEGIPNLDVVSVLGPILPPLRMTVDFHQPQRKITVEDTW